MTQIIKSNIPALNTHRNLLVNSSKVARNLERLSSGFRINRAADDAAGLAISERMRGQIRGLSMAQQNVMQGINLIQTADGALQETHAILQRMRELAVQSSNGTFQDSDRAQIEHEFQALKEEIDRIAESTHYNDIRLLNGDLGKGFAGQAADPPTSTMPTPPAGATIIDSGTLTGSFINEDIIIRGNVTVTSSLDLHQSSTLWIEEGATLTFLGVNSVTIVDSTIHNSGTIGESSLLTGAGSNLHNHSTGIMNRVTLYFFGTSTEAPNVINYGRIDNLFASTGQVTNRGSIGTLTFAPLYSVFFSPSSPLPVVDHYVNVGSIGQVSDPLGRGTINEHGYSIDANYSQGHGLILQIGANGGRDQRMTIFIENMGARFIGAQTLIDDFVSVWETTIATREEANDSIEVLEGGINMVSAQRAKLGAYQNRLEHTLNSLGIARENLTASESTIRDTDMAAEMLRFTKVNILSQAAQAMLAQANQLPQGVVTLLR